MGPSGTRAPARLSAHEKAEMRRRLPSLLAEAGSSKEATHSALRACIAIRRPIPSNLMSSETLADALEIREIVASLSRLFTSELQVDFSSALVAIRTLASKNPGAPSSRQLLVYLAKAVPSRLLKMAGQQVGHRKVPKRLQHAKTHKMCFTAATVSSAANLALWILRHLRENRSRRRIAVDTLALGWVRAINTLWLNAPSIDSLVAAMVFGQSLPSVLTPSAYAKLTSEPSVAQFLEHLTSALLDRAKEALLAGRVSDLKTLFSLVEAAADNRARFFSELRGLCQTRGLDLSPEATEWVAGHLPEPTPAHKGPTAVDESQSASLDYVTACLLSAWDAASEGSRSTRALDTVRRLAQDLFKVGLAGKPGEVVPYDERQHELKSTTASPPSRARVVRPAVFWSDGVRTRVLVRALVEPASSEPQGEAT